MAHGQITHIELPADDTLRARRFYSKLFGWELREMESYAGYFLFTPGRPTLSAEPSVSAVGRSESACASTSRPIRSMRS